MYESVIKDIDAHNYLGILQQITAIEREISKTKDHNKYIDLNNRIIHIFVLTISIADLTYEWLVIFVHTMLQYMKIFNYSTNFNMITDQELKASFIVRLAQVRGITYKKNILDIDILTVNIEYNKIQNLLNLDNDDQSTHDSIAVKHVAELVKLLDPPYTTKTAQDIFKELELSDYWVAKFSNDSIIIAFNKALIDSLLLVYEFTTKTNLQQVFNSIDKDICDMGLFMAIISVIDGCEITRDNKKIILPVIKTTNILKQEMLYKLGLLSPQYEDTDKLYDEAYNIFVNDYKFLSPQVIKNILDEWRV